jgi:diguanylate cyclase (GGDEF)-like protein
VDSLLEDAVQVINSALHPDYFDIGLFDETSGMLRLYRSPHSLDPELRAIPSGRGVIGQVVASGQARRIPDVRLEPDFLAVHPDVQSELCVPLKIKKRIIGALNVESKQPNAFSEGDEHLLMTFADQLVTAIEKVRLFQSEQGHAREAETLREAGAIVAATLSQEETIERILAQLQRVIPYDTASVQLLEDGYMEIVGGNGFADPAAVVGLRFPIPGDNPNTIVVQERRPYIINDAPASHAAFREGPHRHIRSFLGVPLIVGGQIIGMLAIDSTRPNFFLANHVRLVTAFADQVALAIQNAKLFSEVQQLARTDSLTNLHNRRHFTEMARHEFERARRYHHPLTAIMLDIDHFKIVNDTYGHAVGDQVLQIVAARCKAIVREIDVLGRYGGEEFVSLVLETDLKGGQVVAERLRQTVAEPWIDTDHGPITVTISLGIAVLDPQCRDLEDLLRRADQALYAAKQAGRNQVATWRE